MTCERFPGHAVISPLLSSPSWTALRSLNRTSDSGEPLALLGKKKTTPRGLEIGQAALL